MLEVESYFKLFSMNHQLISNSFYLVRNERISILLKLRLMKIN